MLRNPTLNLDGRRFIIRMRLGNLLGKGTLRHFGALQQLSTAFLCLTLLGQSLLPAFAKTAGDALSAKSSTDASSSTNANDASSSKAPDGSILFEVFWNRAQESIKQGKLTEAEDLLDQALEESKVNKNEPLHKKTLSELSNLYLESGRAEKYLECQKELGSIPSTAQLLEASKKYIERNELTGAVTLLEAAQKQFKPANTLQDEQKEILESLADLYSKIGDRHKMVETQHLLSAQTPKKCDGTAVDTYAFFDDSFGSTSNSFEEKLWHADYLASKPPAVDAVLAFLDLLAFDKNGKSSLTESQRVRAIDRFCRLLFKYGRVKRADQLTRDELARLKTIAPSDTQADIHEAYLLTDVALIYVAQSKFTLAEALFDKAYKVFVDALGSNHPKTILTIADMASMKQHMYNLPEAESKYKEAFDQALKQPKYGRLALEMLVIDYVAVLKKQSKDEECDCVKKQIGVQIAEPIHPVKRLETR